MLGRVSEEKYNQVLEQLVRGNSLKESNEGTQLFAKSF